MAKTIPNMLLASRRYLPQIAVGYARQSSCKEAFEQLVGSNKGPDPEMEESNFTRKYFFDALHEVFEVLGGPAWARDHRSQSQSQTTRANAGKEAELDAELNANVEKANFANKAAALGLEYPAHEGPDTTAVDPNNGEESDGPKSAATGHQRRQARPGRGKKKKGGERAKKCKQTAKPEPPMLGWVPIKSYRIIEDAVSVVTDYLMAIYALFEKSTDLRLYMSGLWHGVAYKEPNSAVAATLADLATAVVKWAEAAI